MSETARHFRSLWDQLWASAAAAPDCGSLLSRYDGPQRHYHNAAHIVACLGTIAAWEHATRATVDRPTRVAIFYHDAIYDPKAKDNERKSAALARENLSAFLDPRDIDAVTQLILATEHRHPPTTSSEALIVDADLSILGQPQPLFDAYERAIRQEYAFVPDADFQKGRAAVLRSFLARQQIFTTPWFQKQFEGPARVNLARSLTALENQPPT